jgi:hypothetical protein
MPDRKKLSQPKASRLRRDGAGGGSVAMLISAPIPLQAQDLARASGAGSALAHPLQIFLGAFGLKGETALDPNQVRSSMANLEEVVEFQGRARREESRLTLVLDFAFTLSAVLGTGCKEEGHLLEGGG